MNNIVERLRDLHKQATVERSHYYVGNCALDAADHIEALEVALRRIVNGGTMGLLTASMDECPVNPDVLEQIINDARAALAPQERADG
jgi:hypothetical protein